MGERGSTQVQTRGQTIVKSKVSRSISKQDARGTAMATEPTFITIGTPADKIDVLLSYRIVELFSEGLYASPNKAIEELVANSFDAGALRVLVLHSANLHDQDATIAVIDDGEGMGIEGLKQHWLIGVSNKRNIQEL